MINVAGYLVFSIDSRMQAFHSVRFVGNGNLAGRWKTSGNSNVNYYKAGVGKCIVDQSVF